MSRFGAGLGAGLGAIGGAVGGVYLAQTRLFRGQMLADDAEMAGVALGAIFGSAIGATIGAGSSEPKQVGTSGVGGLYLGSNGGFP